MTYKDYWKAETTIGENTLDAMFQFGLLQEGNARRIVEYNNPVTMNEIAQAGVYNQTFTAGNKPNDRLTAAFFLVNGIPIYWMLGKSTTADLIHTLSNFTEGRKPRISVFTEGDYRLYQALGNCMMALDIEFVLGSPGLYAQCSWKGMSHGTSVATPTATFPSSQQKPYNQFDAFNWNSTEYGIVGFSVKYGQALSTLIGDSGFYQEISEFAPITRAWQVVFKEGTDVTAIIADQQASTARAISAKVMQADDNTKYITFASPTAYCIDIRETRIQGQPARYEAVFVNTTCADLAKDGVADSFYGEA